MSLNDNIIFDPPFSRIQTQLSSSGYAAICGLNNSGKSLILKNLKWQIGSTAYMTGPNRFYHVYHIGTTIRQANRFAQFEQQFNNEFNDKTINREQNYIDLASIISELSDLKREILFEISGKLIGNKFSMKKLEEDNDLSMRYIDMDGQNISVGSTGTRLLMTLVGLCLDERIGTLLIDEPELGLGPKVQSTLATFFGSRGEREKYFPHLNSIVVATHSHLFLDRRDIQNNFVVNKTDNIISVKQIQSFSAFHSLQFNLLGNSLEALFLPSAIVLVEGKTDAPYIEKCVEIHYSNRKVLVTDCQGNLKQKLHSLKEAYGDLYKSPFKNRVFAILDSVHNKSLPAELIKMGMDQSNIIIWQKNGIEYLYPTKILKEIFGCSEERVLDLIIDGDIISLNGVSLKKNALSIEVLKKMGSDTKIPDEINRKFLIPLKTAIG